MPKETLAFLGFGEVGQALARGFVLADSDLPSPKILVADPAFATARGDLLKATAADIGAVCHDEAGSWLAAADVVVSAATGNLAVAVAEQASPFLQPGTLYLDVNTATPEAMRAAAAAVSAQQASFVDVAIMGAIDTHRHRTPMLAAGERAGDVEAWLTPRGFSVRAISVQVGDASALKLLRSVFTKGLEALCVEAFVMASSFGMADKVIENLADLEQKGFAEMIRMLVTTHCRHAGRRLDEVRSLAGLFEEAGVDPVITEATEAVFRRTVQSDIPNWAASRDTLSLEGCLERLRKVAGRTELRTILESHRGSPK